MVPAPDVRQMRVLLRTATAKDALMTTDVLGRAGIESHVCADLRQVVAELREGAGTLLLAEEILAEEGSAELIQLLTTQPQWSDLPVLVLARQGANSRAVEDAMDLSANVTVLERPMRVASLISALRSGLRARRRQYELRRVLEGLRESDQRKTEFLATLAHELRNPMAPLSTTLTLLNRLAPVPAEAKPYYELMGRQVDHMVRLVNDLMEVSRVTRAQIDLHLEDLLVTDVIAAAVEVSRPLVDAAKHHFEIHAEDASLRVKGDSVRLTQVFSNLFNNAAKYTPEGGRIDVWVERSADTVTVRVNDSGVGIPTDMLESVFGMFVQVSGTARAAQGGLGIGLTLVKSIVELHGGTVHATSSGVGRGTQVTVALPLLKVATRPKAVNGAAEAPGCVNDNILIVDDNRDAADSLAAVLELLGAQTAVAYDGEEALQKAAAMRPSIAILDIGMPHMDGCELAQRLRKDPEHAGLGLVALTGWGQSADRKRIDAAGFDRHLLKPVDIADLMKVLQQLSQREP
jgi:signal transduction histidine kinase